MLKNHWAKLVLISLIGILMIGLAQFVFLSIFTPTQGNMGQGMASSGGMGMMGSGGGMGQGMMGMGQGMMGNMGGGGMGMGMMGSGGMGGMSSGGSWMGSMFSLIFTLLIIAAVIGLFAGLIGFAYNYAKKNNLLAKLQNKETKQQTELVVQKEVTVLE
ncbi:hypothetical protein P5G65_23600 [Paenibacillus chondroitinus]|uniref:Uncharacterized protein n=1 Tax=Paenibacillus chondroitinus TaxID=59842 RepID=A0ABU6DH81_9BACL|nr:MULTISPECIES: hypothetical protein [Paenibacillus]MCY9659496.1 hypothetical protein [Paenibacillus anseongense]MEB4796891.1 hypothetical protein [Paenibacillus chondroitinus]